MSPLALDDLFDEILELPDPRLARSYAALVGLDNIKNRLVAESRVILNPSVLRDWSQKAYGQ